jgi:hypothetical protein
MAEPANRESNPAGGKFYVHPVTKERFTSVTTVCDLADKAALKQWAANLAARHAIDNLPMLLAAGLVPVCGNTDNRCYTKHGRENRCPRCPCGRCETCWYRRLRFRHSAESKRRADEGHAVHEAINAWVSQGGLLINLPPEAQIYFDQFLAFTRDYGLTPRADTNPGSWEQTEATMLNRKHMYAGTSDGAIWLRRGAAAAADAKLDLLGRDEALIRVDYKTREKTDGTMFYDHAWQGEAYENCDVVMLPDGTELPAPKTHARAILQLHPEGYIFKLMDPTGAFEAFLGILAAYRWIEERGKTVFAEQAASFHPRPIAVPAAPAHLPNVETARSQQLSDAVAGSPTAPRVPRVSATAEVDAFELAGAGRPDPSAALGRPKTTKAGAVSATIQSLRNFDPGTPVLENLTEATPF